MIDCSPVSLIFPLESFCLEDVTVHETSLGMSQYIFLLDWGALVKQASKGIKVLIVLLYKSQYLVSLALLLGDHPVGKVQNLNQ